MGWLQGGVDEGGAERRSCGGGTAQLTGGLRLRSDQFHREAPNAPSKQYPQHRNHREALPGAVHVSRYEHIPTWKSEVWSIYGGSGAAYLPPLHSFLVRGAGQAAWGRAPPQAARTA